jgi:Gpi18-like mannosyltransferase
MANFNNRFLRKWIIKYPKFAYTFSTLIYILFFIIFLNWITVDMLAYMDWFQSIVTKGAAAFKEYNFGYSPASMYLFILATLLPFQSYIDIKLIALPFIPVSGLIISHLVYKLTHDRVSAWLGYTATILLPTILTNASLWGQTDIYYSLMALLCIFFIIRKKPYAAIIAWSISLSLKAPALFLAPFLLIMLIRKQIPWKTLWIPPFVYIAFSIPFILLGSPILNTLGIYVTQSEGFHSLCMNCASIWSFFQGINYDIGVVLGIGLAFVSALIYMVLVYLKLDLDDPRQIILAAILSAILIPFLLPKMHDRYFYFAEMLSISIIFIDWRYFLVTILLQISTLIGYWHFLQNTSSPSSTSFSASMILAVLAILIWTIFRPKVKPVLNNEAISYS